jgi:hypothetical protein
MVDGITTVFPLAAASGIPLCVELVVAMVCSGTTCLGVSYAVASVVTMLLASLPVAGLFIFVVVVGGSTALVV